MEGLLQTALALEKSVKCLNYNFSGLFKKVCYISDIKVVLEKKWPRIVSIINKPLHTQFMSNSVINDPHI